MRKTLTVMAMAMALVLSTMAAAIAAPGWTTDNLGESNSIEVTVEDGRLADVTLEVWDGSAWSDATSITVGTGEEIPVRVTVADTGTEALTDWKLGLAIAGDLSASDIEVYYEGGTTDISGGTSGVRVIDDGGGVFFEGSNDTLGSQRFDVVFNTTGTFTGTAYVIDTRE